MRRKFGVSTVPNLYFREPDGVLSIPGYTFEKVRVDVLLEALFLLDDEGSAVAGYGQYDVIG
jgi:hypothetical protein